MEEAEDIEGDIKEEDFGAELLLVCIAATEKALYVREVLMCRQRLVWSEHVDVLRRENSFARVYRMDEASFAHLVNLLRPDLTVDAHMSTVRTGVAPISAEVVMHCTLRWLAGGSYLDIRCIGQISVASFFRCLHKGLNAIVDCLVLKLRLPKTRNEIVQAAAEFAEESDERVFDGCVGCIDGVLIRIKTTSHCDASNSRSYYSGHYHAMGLNVQAVCDYKSRFIFMAVAAPGSTSDVRALRRTTLPKYIASLPDCYYLIGDCAYTPSEHMLTPFAGSSKNITALDNYNFFLSQLRIKIEMAFGLMTTKWRRLRSPLQVRLTTATTVIMAIGRLHNYCIDHRQNEGAASHIEPVIGNIGYIPSESGTVSVQGSSELRAKMVEFIKDCNLARPERNLNRRARGRG